MLSAFRSSATCSDPSWTPESASSSRRASHNLLTGPCRRGEPSPRRKTTRSLQSRTTPTKRGGQERASARVDSRLALVRAERTLACSQSAPRTSSTWRRGARNKSTTPSAERRCLLFDLRTFGHCCMANKAGRMPWRLTSTDLSVGRSPYALAETQLVPSDVHLRRDRKSIANRPWRINNNH